MTKQISNKVKKLNNLLLDEFSTENDMQCIIVENIPEWNRLINCKQHNIHDFTLDVHTFQVIRRIRESTCYRLLVDVDKLIVLYAGLLHDIDKAENAVDPQHPQRGAELSSEILYRLGFSEEFISSVYILIKYHQVLGLIASGKITFSSEELAKIYHNSTLIELQSILAIADIKSVKKNEAFYNENVHGQIHKVVNELKAYLST